MTDQTPAAPLAPKTEFLDGPAPRTITVPLTWPVIIDGMTYREVTIRRVNGRESRDYYASCMATLTHGTPAAVYPGLDLPQSVWDQLDDDDVTAIDEAVEDFLPERFVPLTALMAKLMGRPTNEEAGDNETVQGRPGGLSSEPGAS